MTRRIVIVTGSKDWKDRNVIFEVLDETLNEVESQGFDLEIHVGDAAGADYFTQEWASITNGREFLKSDRNRNQSGRVKVEVYHARWAHCSSACGAAAGQHMKMNRNGGMYCPSAGMRRNAWMVARGAWRCIAFILDCSSGSTRCSEMADKAGIDVKRLRQGRLPADNSDVDNRRSRR